MPRIDAETNPASHPNSLGWLAGGTPVVMSRTGNGARTAGTVPADPEAFGASNGRFTPGGVGILPKCGEPPQHIAALARANVIRSKRAATRHDVRDGRRALTDVIDTVDWYMASALVADVVRYQNGIGHHAMHRLLRGLCSESKTLGALTDRQRLELLARLPERRLAGAS